MDNDQARRYANIDALLAQATTPLPDVSERQRLRKAAAMSLQQVAQALEISSSLLADWESGLAEPTGADRTVYARLLNGLSNQAHHGHIDPASVSSTARTDAHPSPHQRTAPHPPAPAHSPPPAAHLARRNQAKTSPNAAREVFPAGPLAVLDATDTGALTAHFSDGTSRDCPADTIIDVLHWALDAGLGQPRLTPYDRPADPLVVLTRSATDYLGLPPELEDRAALRLSKDHRWCAAITTAGWKFTHRGFGPWARIYQPIRNNRRRSVQFAVIPWGALSTGGWNPPTDLTPGQLARWLGTYAERVLTPCGSTAACGQELMTALRPPTRPVRSPAGGWQSGNNPGALWHPVPPAPPEAHDAHPLAQGRDPSEAMDEEAWDWHRPLTIEETVYPHVVGLDINLAFVAAAGSLAVGLNAPPEHVSRPAFDKKIPGAWYCDLSHISLDPCLPSPFTPSGLPPAGPAWYATPTVAYAIELGFTVNPTEAYLRNDSGRYLDPWYKHLRDAYMATMHDLAITSDMTQADFLEAMRTLPQQDPYLLSLLAAIKATGKGGIGKLRAGPHNPHHAPFELWPALSTPTWRPDIRAAVIARARINMHRKMLRTVQATGCHPLAVLSDCVLYPAHHPTALDAIPQDTDGTGISGAFRVGASPGLVKEEGTQSIQWYRQLHDEGINPARYIKATNTP